MRRVLLFLACWLLLSRVSLAAPEIRVRIDPLTRYAHFSYQVPDDAPEMVEVHCAWSAHSTNTWQPARVTPSVSETALNLVDDVLWSQWQAGHVTEQRAGGLTRTVVWNPYPEAQGAGRVDADFRIEILDEAERKLASHTVRVRLDNSDVLFLEDWTRVLQPDKIGRPALPGERKWSFETDLAADLGVTLGNSLRGFYTADIQLPSLTWPLDLRGWYAIYVRTRPHYGIRLRLTGDERADMLSSWKANEEVLWRWCRMDRQHLVISQPHSHTGYVEGQVDYVKLVPLDTQQVNALQAPQRHEHDRLLACYYEPYSWAFVEDVQSTLMHREPLAAFAEAGAKIVDIQLGRFGSKANYESRLLDRIDGDTLGDPIDGVVPTTPNVAKMQHYTNMFQACLRYAPELGMRPHANFGATACYRDTLAQGDFSKQHPEWMRGDALRYEVPEVREHILRVYQEALEIGAEAVSIDFCRYPEGIDTAETCTEFLRALRELTNQSGQSRNIKIPILIRFPAHGVRLADRFDYATWLKEDLVDFLCPSNIQGRHMHFDIAPYVAAMGHSPCQLLPVVDGLSWGTDMPGPFLWRVRSLFRAGVDGIYVYQADGRILSSRPGYRRCMQLLGSTRAVDAWWADDERQRSGRSKGIYLNYSETGGWNFHNYERGRVWLEGVPLGEVEMLLDGKPLAHYASPPYVVGSEEYDSDQVLSSGPHELTVRARDGQGWIERTFAVHAP